MFSCLADCCEAVTEGATFEYLNRSLFNVHKALAVTVLLENYSEEYQVIDIIAARFPLPSPTHMQQLTSDAWPKEGGCVQQWKYSHDHMLRCIHSTLAYHSLPTSIICIYSHTRHRLEGLLDEILRPLQGRQFPSARAHSLSIHSRILSYLPQSDSACLHLHRT